MGAWRGIPLTDVVVMTAYVARVYLGVLSCPFAQVGHDSDVTREEEGDSSLQVDLSAFGRVDREQEAKPKT